MKFPQRPVIPRHFPFALKHMDFDTCLASAAV
jgi:hypothetical protein